MRDVREGPSANLLGFGMMHPRDLPPVEASPYTLPEGNVQIAFSGGRTSAYMLHQILEANGGLPGRVEVTFQNTGFEHEATLDFVAEVGRRWGVMVTWLEYLPAAPHFQIVGHQGAARMGEPFRALVTKCRYLPNQKSRFCTIELKVRTAKRYLVSLGWERWTSCVGFRADEPDRLNKPPPRDRWTVWTPLATANVARRDVHRFWQAQPFNLELPDNDGKTPLGNCIHCFLKGERTQASVARDFPEHQAIWEDMEAEIGAIWPSLTRWQRLRRMVRADPDLAGNLREGWGRNIPPSVLESVTDRPQSAAQFSRRFSKASLRRLVEKQGDWILSDEAGLCAKAEGECT